MESCKFVLLLILLNYAYAEEKCGKNEEFQNQGFDCATCENYKYVRCAFENATKCYCKSGYIRDKDRQCVLIEDCPKNCSKNETYQESGYDCRTCDKLYAKCSLETSPKCYCKSGYVRNETKACVLQEDCHQESRKCSRNETYDQGGYDCLTCSKLDLQCDYLNSSKCYCKNGLVRNETNDCIARKDCPKSPEGQNCSKNETFQESGYDCQTCDRQFAKCAEETVPKCYCKNGYIRDKDSNCILKEDCSKCGENEEYRTCPRSCEPTCKGPHPSYCSCRPGYKGCVCKYPFIRDYNEGSCIEPRSCRRRNQWF